MQKENPGKIKNTPVAIYIDASNIIMSMDNLDYEINFSYLFKYLSDRFRTNNIFYFTPELNHINKNLSFLHSLGFKIVKKDTYFYQKSIKANCDVEISHYITRDIKDKLYKKIILLSGDGDFSMLLDYANNNNIGVGVISANKKSTAKLIRTKKYFRVEYIIDLISAYRIKEISPLKLD